MQIKWTDLANDDLEHIEHYIAKDNSPTVAIDVVLRIITSVENILPGHPRAGRAGRLKGTRELVIAGIPFIVVYRIREPLQQLQILRILHGAQQWPPA